MTVEMDHYITCVCCGETFCEGSAMKEIYMGQGISAYVCAACQSKPFREVHNSLNEGVTYNGNVKILPGETVTEAHMREKNEHKGEG